MVAAISEEEKQKLAANIVSRCVQDNTLHTAFINAAAAGSSDFQTFLQDKFNVPADLAHTLATAQKDSLHKMVGAYICEYLW